MKKFFDDILDKDTLFILFISLLLGLFIGVFFQSGYSVGLRTLYHKIYLKFHPEVQKDTKTIIIDKVSEDNIRIPQTDIFEDMSEKDNKLIIILKKIFTPSKKLKQENKPTIDDEF